MEYSKDHIQLERNRFLAQLKACSQAESLSHLRTVIDELRHDAVAASFSDGDVISFRQDILLEEIDQIAAARTLERAKYYVSRLQREAAKVRTPKFSDINLNRWKEYDDLITDSLWVETRRDQTGAHEGWYHGNFIPQIPHQMIQRFTKAGDWVMDTFSGSGTTLIECRRLGRNGLGIELNADIAQHTRDLLADIDNPYHVQTHVTDGDCTGLDYVGLLAQHNVEQVQLLMMHPPYHDIIRFSDDPRDLSNAEDVETFLARFTDAVKQSYPILEPGRHLVVVIGDKYSHSEWIPLGFYVMQSVMSEGYTLKSIVVKNFDSTRAKREQQALWRYRALAGGFFVFKHEYILVFQK